MTPDELIRLIQGGESSRVEFKSKANPKQLDRVWETVCGFANDLEGAGGGVIVFGVDDSGMITGETFDDEKLLRLSGFRDGQIVPVPTGTVEKIRVDGQELVVMKIKANPFPPVRFNGRAYVRVGTRTSAATASDEALLSQRRSAPVFDLSPVPGADVSDLDLEFFRQSYLSSAVAPDVLQANERPIGLQLVATRMAVNAEDPSPTVTGLLTLCPRVRDFIPGAYVQFSRFDGPDLSDPIRDAATLDGTLTDVIRRLDEKIEAHIETAVTLDRGPTEEVHPTYPLVALQQITRNAIMHRSYEFSNAPVRVLWYSDRVEVISPGGPFGIVTKENFGSGITDYRNPHVAEAMRTLGYVQRFGVGISVARDHARKNGNRIEWRVEQTTVLCTIWKAT